MRKWRNLAAEHPAVVERLRGELRKLGFFLKDNYYCISVYYI